MVGSLRNNGLAGKVVLIASQRSGVCIPAEMAKIFLIEGAAVQLVDTSDKITRDVQEAVRAALGAEVAARTVDPNDLAEIGRCVSEVVRAHGRLDVLVTDIGLLEFVPHLKPFQDQSVGEWRQQYENIVERTMAWSQAVIPQMIAQGSGRIVHISSEAARVGTPGMSAYAAAKAAVAAFSRCLAVELARHAITVNCVSLGIQEIEDRSGASRMPIEKLEKIKKSIPLRRYGEPEEVAYMVAFLASDLGSYVTGQNLSVSGGMVMN
ncbi:MAG: SDR family oxidoreductase [Deltaproteobacteria bacterium]|nr:SDR family oxidoreductase [Deltaproteobacteria bacterium]